MVWYLQERNSDHTRKIRVVTIDVNYIMFRNEKNQIEYISWPMVERLVQQD